VLPTPRPGESDEGGNHRPDGAYWYYAHLSRWNTDDFDSGDSVAPGDVIGYCGNTGNAATTPSHVHFGLYGPDGRAADPMAWLVRWLRAAERSAGLRRLSSAPDPVELELQALLPDHDVAVAPAPRPLRAPAIERFDTAGDAPQSLRRAGISHVVEAWTPTRPSAGDRALEFVGLGALLVTVYMMRARWNGDRSEVPHRTRRHLPEGGRSGR
jgi:murein DD-endopeptidase MepM/ murein hydrolase activator NlpD